MKEISLPQTAASMTTIFNESIDPKSLTMLTHKCKMIPFGRKVLKRENVVPWDDYFMSVAFLSAMRSKDPSTQVGACIVNKDKRIVGIGMFSLMLLFNATFSSFLFFSIWLLQHLLFVGLRFFFYANNIIRIFIIIIILIATLITLTIVSMKKNINDINDIAGYKNYNNEIND